MAVDVRVHHVLGRRVEARERFLEALPVAGALEAQKPLGGAARLQRRPLQGKPPPDRALGILDAFDDRPVASDHHLLEHVRGAFDVDDLAQPPGRLESPLRTEMVAGGGVRTPR